MKILACFAHPDDETILGGGLLALLASDINEVHYMCCTRGEGGECGTPPLCNQNALGDFRENELKCAVENLGGKSLNILDFIDPMVGPENTLFSFTEDIEKISTQIKDFIQREKIDVIITHGSNGEYGHPGHKTVYQAANLVINNYFPNLYWYTVQAFYPNSTKAHLLNKNDVASWIIDVSSVLNQKIKAALCHKSQHSLFTRRKSTELGREVSVEEVISFQESYYFANGIKDLLKENPVIKRNLMYQKEDDEI
jgi:LmbE family N-acetylglucosaminyl deacetylase